MNKHKSNGSCDPVWLTHNSFIKATSIRERLICSKKAEIPIQEEMGKKRLFLNACNTIIIPCFHQSKFILSKVHIMSSNLNKYKRLSVHLCTS